MGKNQKDKKEGKQENKAAARHRGENFRKKRLKRKKIPT